MLKGAQASSNATTQVVDLMTFVEGRLKKAGKPLSSSTPLTAAPPPGA